MSHVLDLLCDLLMYIFVKAVLILTNSLHTTIEEFSHSEFWQHFSHFPYMPVLNPTSATMRPADGANGLILKYLLWLPC